MKWFLQSPLPSSSPPPFPYLGICFLEMAQLFVSASIPVFCLASLTRICSPCLYTPLLNLSFCLSCLSLCVVRVSDLHLKLYQPPSQSCPPLLKPSLSPFFKLQLLSSVTAVWVYHKGPGSPLLGVVAQARGVLLPSVPS